MASGGRPGVLRSGDGGAARTGGGAAGCTGTAETAGAGGTMGEAGSGPLPLHTTYNREKFVLRDSNKVLLDRKIVKHTKLNREIGHTTEISVRKTVRHTFKSTIGIFVLGNLIVCF
jgi:hypothetical protein